MPLDQLVHCGQPDGAAVLGIHLVNLTNVLPVEPTCQRLRGRPPRRSRPARPRRRSAPRRATILRQPSSNWGTRRPRRGRSRSPGAPRDWCRGMVACLCGAGSPSLPAPSSSSPGRRSSPSGPERGQSLTNHHLGEGTSSSGGDVGVVGRCAAAGPHVLVGWLGGVARCVAAPFHGRMIGEAVRTLAPSPDALEEAQSWAQRTLGVRMSLTRPLHSCCRGPGKRGSALSRPSRWVLKPRQPHVGRASARDYR